MNRLLSLSVTICASIFFAITAQLASADSFDPKAPCTAGHKEESPVGEPTGEKLMCIGKDCDGKAIESEMYRPVERTTLIQWSCEAGTNGARWKQSGKREVVVCSRCAQTTEQCPQSRYKSISLAYHPQVEVIDCAPGVTQ